MVTPRVGLVVAALVPAPPSRLPSRAFGAKATTACVDPLMERLSDDSYQRHIEGGVVDDWGRRRSSTRPHRCSRQSL